MKCMRLSLFLAAANYAASTAFALSTFGGSSGSTKPVCIVGAGPAGLAAAARLQARNIPTVIFEKQATVGGKCQNAYDDKGRFYPTGALLFSNGTYTEALKIIDAVGVPSKIFNYDATAYLFEYKTGHVENVTAPAIMSAQEPLNSQINSYNAWWTSTFQKQFSIGFKGGIPYEYTQPFFSWLLTNGYTDLLPLMVGAMIPYGYGSMFEVPTIYMLTYLTPDIMNFFAGRHPGYIIDFQEVFKRHVAANINGPLYLSTTITNIDRSFGSPIITYTRNGQSSKQQCSKLIMAFPPTVSNLAAANLNIDLLERGVFENVGTVKYFSGAVRMSQTPHNPIAGLLRKIPLPTGSDQFIQMVPEGKGQPVAFIKIYDDSEIATTWSWAGWQSNVTLSDAHDLLLSTFSNINRDVSQGDALPGTPVTDSDIYAFREQDYFPHVSTAALIAGFYTSFNNLQGYKNTYYASGLNAMETVEMALRAGNDVVDTYFPASKLTTQL